MINDMSFFYDNFSDRLMISNKKIAEKVQGSIRVLNLTIDFVSNNKPVNVEIRNVSEYLESVGIDTNILNNLEDVKLSFRPYKDGLMIYFTLKSKDAIERVPYNIPMRTPIAC